MRRRLLWFMLIAVVFLCTGRAETETGSEIRIDSTEWSWEDEATPLFEGTADLTGLENQSLTMKLIPRVTPEDAGNGEAAFLMINGKQLTLRKQGPEYKAGNDYEAKIEFTGYWKHPNKKDIQEVEITLQILGEDGTVLKDGIMKKDRSLNLFGDNIERLNISFNADQWILYAGIAAGIIWLLALARIIKNRTQK